jgi:hypothetical protein
MMVSGGILMVVSGRFHAFFILLDDVGWKLGHQ